MIDPAAHARIACTAARIPSMGPVTLTRIVRSHPGRFFRKIMATLSLWLGETISGLVP